MRTRPKKIRYRPEILRQRVNERKPNVTVLCRDHGFHRTTFYDALNGAGHISIDMIEKIASALDLKLSDVFQLDETPHILAQ